MTTCLLRSNGGGKRTGRRGGGVPVSRPCCGWGLASLAPFAVDHEQRVHAPRRVDEPVSVPRRLPPARPSGPPCASRLAGCTQMRRLKDTRNKRSRRPVLL